MKRFRAFIVLLLVPLLLSFTYEEAAPDDVYVRPFVIKPLVIDQRNVLTFNYFILGRSDVSVNTNLTLTNRTYNNKILGTDNLLVRQSRDAIFSISIPPTILTTGLNYFTLTYTFNYKSLNLAFKVGANYQAMVTLPSSTLLLNAYYGAHYNNSIMHEIQYMFDPRPFSQQLIFTNDLLFQFSSIRAHYPSSNEFTYHDATIVFTGKRGIFPRLPLNSDGEPYLYLKLEMIDSFLYFSLRDPLYVDDETHMISPTKDIGFRLTNQFYFPKNKIEDICYGKYQIMIHNFSTLQLDITYTFSLHFLAPYFGPDGTYFLDMEWN